MPNTKERWTLSNKAAIAALVIFLLWTAIEIVRILLGRAEELKYDVVIPGVGLGLVAWTYIYVVLHETQKRIFGIGEMILGFALMVPQLYELREKISQHDAQHNMSWRVTLIVGLVALMAQGMEDLIKSIDEDEAGKQAGIPATK